MSQEKPYGGSFGPVAKVATTLPFGRGYLVDMGALEPTAQERAEMDARAAEWKRKEALRAQADIDMLAALRAKGDPVTDAVVDLHHASGGRCDGCDYDGWESESPEWPCRTIYAVAKAHGIPTREDVR